MIHHGVNSGAEIQQLVKKFDLQPHPEGGYYKEIHRCQDTIPLSRGVRNVSTAIYYLLKGDTFSAFHRFKSEEIWHYYRGASLNIYIIQPNGTLEVRRLGDPIEDLHAEPQIVVPANVWFAASLDTHDPNQYTFVGCTVAPGFDFQDFELGARVNLVGQFPQAQAAISQYTRS